MKKIPKYRKYDLGGALGGASKIVGSFKNIAGNPLEDTTDGTLPTQIDSGKEIANGAATVGTDILSDASTGAAIGGPWGAVAGAIVGLGRGVAETVGNHNKLSKQIEANQSKNIGSMYAKNPQSNAYGQYKYGGIHIKKSHEGRFTAYKKRTGKTTEEALHSKDPHVRQMANFARNASHWKHALGGQMDGDNEEQLVRYEGPKHEDGGIKLSNNAEVEGGETSYKNYVFSDSLFVGKKSLADISKKIDNKFNGKNDSISNRTKEIELTNLMDLNENMRKQVEVKRYGGKMCKYGGNPYSAVFEKPKYKGVAGNQNVFDKGGTMPPFTQAKEDPGIEIQDTIDMSDGMDHTPLTNNRLFRKPEDLEKVNLDTSYTNSIDNPYTPNLNISKVDVNPLSIDSNKPQTPNQKLTTGDAIQLASSIPSTIFNLAQSLRPYDKVKPTLNPYSQKIKDLMSNRKYNPQSIINDINVSANAAKQSINDNTLSDSVRRANLASNYNAVNNAVANANLNGQNMNNQLRGEEAGMLNQLGNQEVNQVNLAYEDEQKNKANRNNFGAATATGLSQALASAGQFINQNKTNQISMQVLNSMAKNFGVDPNTFKIMFKNTNPNISIV